MTNQVEESQLLMKKKRSKSRSRLPRPDLDVVEIPQAQDGADQCGDPDLPVPGGDFL